MAETPPKSPDNQQFTGCPYCTIQIPADAKVCPHCQQVLNLQKKLGRPSAFKKESDFILRLLAEKRRTLLYDMWTRYGKWIKVAGPALAAALLLLIVYGVWVGYKVHVVPNPGLSVKVMHEKKGQTVVLNVFVTNEGEDIPDLSLKSIGVVTEFVYRDGRREKKTVFPKAEFRGEGSLLHGETGSFEIEAPAKGLKEVNLRSEIVDLGTDRKLVPPGGRRRYVPEKR
jgi:predicted nucleic acid-binding Zn ribbon protein